MSNEVEKIITDIVQQVLSIDISKKKLLETPFAEMSVNSFDFIKIIVDIENEFGIEVEPTKLNIGTFKDIKSLSKYINYLIASKSGVSS